MESHVVLPDGESADLLSKPFDRLKENIRKRIKKEVNRAIVHGLFSLLRITYGFRVEGEENLPDDGPYILIVNEWSLISTTLSGWLLVRQIHRMRSRNKAIMYLMQEELWRIRFFRDMAHAGAIGKFAPLEPHGAGRMALGLMDGYRTLRDGGMVIMNPEGDMPWDGRPLPTAHGVYWLALHSAAPVVIALVSPAAYDVWPRWQARPNLRGKLRMTIRAVTLTDAPKARVTNEDMAAAAVQLNAVYNEMRYGEAGLTAWAGPALRNGQPLAEPLALPLVKPPPPVAAPSRPALPVAKRGLVQLLWRCPICHAEDALEYTHPALRAQRVQCRACNTVWRVKRRPGHDFRLSVVSGPPEALGLEMALSAWYDTIKNDFRPVARDLPGIDLLPGEEPYLAVDSVPLMPHCPSALLNGWTDIEPPRLQPPGAPQHGDWQSIGAGRLVLTNQRLHWQGERQLDFYWAKVSAVFLWELNTLGIRYGTAPYRFPLQGELGIKWLTYAGTQARQAAAQNGANVTVSHF